MHAIVPLDGSERSTRALAIARLLALAFDGELTLVHVLPADVQPGTTRDIADSLHAVAAGEWADGLEVHVTVRIGDPGIEILQLASELNADLIVMAMRGRSGPTRGLLGSVTDQILRSTSVPVLLLHPNGHEVEQLKTIVVAVDGTPGSGAAVSNAVALAQTTHARLVLVRAAAEPYAEGLARRLQRAGLAAEGHGVSGQPGPAILSVADEVDADLIVMSTHARTGLVRSVLGSVADQVVRKSHRPVLLVRRASCTGSKRLEPPKRVVAATDTKV